MVVGGVRVVAASKRERGGGRVVGVENPLVTSKCERRGGVHGGVVEGRRAKGDWAWVCGGVGQLQLSFPSSRLAAAAVTPSSRCSCGRRLCRLSSALAAAVPSSSLERESRGCGSITCHVVGENTRRRVEMRGGRVVVVVWTEPLHLAFQGWWW